MNSVPARVPAGGVLKKSKMYVELVLPSTPLYCTLHNGIRLTRFGPYRAKSKSNTEPKKTRRKAQSVIKKSNSVHTKSYSPIITSVLHQHTQIQKAIPPPIFALQEEHSIYRYLNLPSTRLQSVAPRVYPSSVIPHAHA